MVVCFKPQGIVARGLRSPCKITIAGSLVFGVTLSVYSILLAMPMKGLRRNDDAQSKKAGIEILTISPGRIGLSIGKLHT
jgi:hypothetical protein